jgi:hypothetical protein
MVAALPVGTDEDGGGGADLGQEEAAAIDRRIGVLAEQFALLQQDMRESFAQARTFLDFVRTWAVVEVSGAGLRDMETAHSMLSAAVQQALGAEALRTCSIHTDQPRRRCSILCPRGSAAGLIEALNGPSRSALSKGGGSAGGAAVAPAAAAAAAGLSCRMSRRYPRQLVVPALHPAPPPNLLCYKLVERRRGRFWSVYDGVTEYRLGQPVEAAGGEGAQPSHRAGLYVYRTAEQALRCAGAGPHAGFPPPHAMPGPGPGAGAGAGAGPRQGGGSRALLLVEAAGPYCEYPGGKLACSSLTPIEVVMRRVRRPHWTPNG